MVHEEENLPILRNVMRNFYSPLKSCDPYLRFGHYQQMLYVIFSLLGMYVEVEVRTPKGRVDIVMRTATTLYVMELKIGEEAAAGMKQIDLKDYPSRFALYGLPMVKVAVSFDKESHAIGDWKIALA